MIETSEIIEHVGTFIKIGRIIFMWQIYIVEYI